MRGRPVPITGGAGFVGSHVPERRMGEEAQIALVDNFDPLSERTRVRS